MRRSVLRLTTLAGVLVAALLLGAGNASAAAPPAQPIGPHQFFTATINKPLPVGPPHLPIVKVVCPGPAGLGRTGHPLAGQPVRVFLTTPTRFPHGNTGPVATSIVATFPADRSVSLKFTQYGVPQPIPTRLLLPCSGFGTVGFVPTPTGPGAVALWLNVRFIDVAP